MMTKKQKGFYGLLYGCLTTLIICMFLYMLTSNISGSKAATLNVEPPSKNVSLTNHNIVDFLASYTNTKYLYKVQLKRNNVLLQFKLPNDQDIEAQISMLLPQYLKLLFENADNIYEARLHFIAQQENELQIYSMLIHRDDAWLHESWSFLEEQGWLEDEWWIHQMNITSRTEQK